MARKIVGFEKFTSKKGTPTCAVCTETDFKKRDNVQQVGIKTEVCMIYGDSVEVITDKAIGKELVGFFGYSNGMCVVQSPQVQ